MVIPFRSIAGLLYF
uniref:Uncharacterized protein n=1 Tax=Rhizophora mucronata TaxID=61149 RepID=A0A2P2PQD2_RHIMU